MKIDYRRIGTSRSGESEAIEVTVRGEQGDAEVTEDVTGLCGKVSEEFINDLRETADVLEEQNRLVKASQKKISKRFPEGGCDPLGNDL